MKRIPSFLQYFASRNGKIFRNGREISQRSNNRGYNIVTLSTNGIVNTRYVHRLVCEAFYGPCPTGRECAHLNGDRQDNRADNLQWVTKQENESHKETHGTRLHGELAPNAKLTAAIVNEARNRVRNGERMDAVALSYGINDRVMADAISGRRWARLPGALGACYTRRKFSDDEVREIRKRARNETDTAIAAKYGVRRNTIYQIKMRKSYRHVN